MDPFRTRDTDVFANGGRHPTRFLFQSTSASRIRAESPPRGAFKIYDEPESPTKESCLRYMVSRKCQKMGRV